MSNQKVLVAMSGGVDSSAAALLLKEQGYDVHGITLKLVSFPRELCQEIDQRNCCGWSAQEDAARAADRLDIPHQILDLREEFEKRIISDFTQNYSRGLTPNPCILCNKYIKFGALIQEAEKRGYDHVATGHHARIDIHPSNGLYQLKKGKDKDKDQSYFLYTLSQAQLRRILFPIGGHTKADIREIARNAGLPAAERPESQEICFIPDNDYSRFLKEVIPEAFKPGEIVDPEGRTLGHHDGIPHYTIGQRRGLGISASQPLYVLAIEPEKNRIVVGKNEELYRSSLIATSAHLVSGEKKPISMTVKARIRYKHKESPAQVTFLEDKQARVDFKHPQRAVTPGQSVVFYKGDTVLGGGIIRGSIAC